MWKAENKNRKQIRGENFKELYTGKQVKEMINRRINDEDIVCFGQEGDKIGRFDCQITGIENRQIGFDSNETYKAIVTRPYHSNGAMKFWKE